MQRLSGVLLLGMFLTGCGAELESEADPFTYTGDPAPEALVTAAVCSSPVKLVDVSKPTTVVGTGSATSCTSALLVAAAKKGGIITFRCGSAPATIKLSQTLELPTDRDTVIDGANLVTLDGGSQRRILRFNHGNFRTSSYRVIIQNLRFVDGHASGTAIAASSQARASQGTLTDGGGGAIWVRDGKLVVINSVFESNDCAQLGPDVGGGAIYALGSLDVTIVGSRFSSNVGANGGALGFLNSTVTLVNDRFEQNHAVGHGGNGVNSSPKYQVGSGGLGGAFYMDGGVLGTTTVCGATFTGNRAIAAGGAFLRIEDAAFEPLIIDRSTFDGNAVLAPPSGEKNGSGGALYVQNSKFSLTNSTISNNTSVGAGGGADFEHDELTLTNVTFAGNEAKALGGGTFLGWGNSGTYSHVTFAANKITSGAGVFSAAISASGGQTLNVHNSIFANNTTGDSGSPMTCAFTPFPGSGNVQWPRNHVVGTKADTACASGTTWADPQLGPLAQNGGPTQTLSPSSSSPARKNGDVCAPADQRGVTRPASDCTSGAVQ